MDILHVSLEFAPYGAATPTAEAVSGLCRTLKSLGHEVTVIVPYRTEYEARGLFAARRLTPLPLSCGEEALVFEAQLPSGVSLVLVKTPGAELGPSDAQLLGEDRCRKLGLFGRAVTAFCQERASLGRAPEVLHVHDAEAGLCLMGLDAAGLTASGTVLTVYDASHAGLAPLAMQVALGIPNELISAHGFASGEQICLLKGLLGFAGKVVTPSSAYARGLCTPERHGALARAFHAAEPLGIACGVDVAVYNSASDPSLVARFDAAEPRAKGLVKSDLQSRLELTVSPARPLFLVECVPGGDAALATVLAALPALVRLDLQLVIAGFGERGEAELALTESFRTEVRWLDTVDPLGRRRLLAAADFYLSVQRHDPCALAVRQAARYGAVPVALEVDGVADAVIDCDAELSTGTGFLIDAMTQRSLTGTVARAVAAHQLGAMQTLRKRLMRQDLGWDRPTRQYVQVYQKVRSERA